MGKPKGVLYTLIRTTEAVVLPKGKAIAFLVSIFHFLIWAAETFSHGEPGTIVSPEHSDDDPSWEDDKKVAPF